MSFCRITFCGLNISRLLNEFCKVGIIVESCEKRGKLCEIVVKKTHYGKVVALLRQKCYNIQNVQWFGNASCVTFVKRHAVLVVATILLVALLAVFSNLCLKIVVNGDFPQDTVLSALAELEVDKWCNLAKLDIDKTENTLATKLDGMYAVINRKGSVLYVNVIAKKVTDSPIDMHKRRDIVATCDGTVVSLLCEQGLPVVQVGDVVKKGDVLIAGLRQFNDETSQDVYALGKVMLQMQATGFAKYDGTITKFEPTGNKQQCTQVVLFGKSYGNRCTFAHYDLQQTTTFLHPLNLQINYTTYYELAKVTVSATVDECLPILTQQALQIAQQNCNFAVRDTQFITTNQGVTAVLLGQVEIS